MPSVGRYVHGVGCDQAVGAKRFDLTVPGSVLGVVNDVLWNHPVPRSFGPPHDPARTSGYRCHLESFGREQCLLAARAAHRAARADHLSWATILGSRLSQRTDLLAGVPARVDWRTNRGVARQVRAG